MVLTSYNADYCQEKYLFECYQLQLVDSTLKHLPAMFNQHENSKINIK